MQPQVIASSVTVGAGTVPQVASAPARPVVVLPEPRSAPSAPPPGQAVSTTSDAVTDLPAPRRLRRWWPAARRRRAGTWAAALAVLDASADAVVGVDADGRTVFANAAATALLGRTAGDLVGTPARDLVPELPCAVAEARRRMLAGEPTNPTGEGLDLVAVGRCGGDVPVTGWLTPVHGPDGALLVAVTLRDLRPQHDLDDMCLRLDEEARTSRAVVDTLLRAVTDRVVVLADPDGRITQVNRAAEKLLGYRSEELVGRPTTRLSDPGDLEDVARELGVPAGVDPLLELARWGLPNRQDWDFVTRDGRRRPVSLAVTAVGQREAPHGFVCVASDRGVEWQPLAPRRPRQSGERLLLDLDDAATRVLRWGVGRSGGRPGA